MKMACALAFIAVASVTLALAVTGLDRSARAAQPLDQIYISTTSLVSGKINVAVSTTGSSQGDFSGDNITLTYNTAQLTYSGFNTTGSILGSGQICFAAVFAPGEDAVACGGTAGGTSLAGLLNTIVLTPSGTGCATIHILTRGAPDNAGDSFGTQTDDANTGSPQNNTYGPDVAVDLATGAACAGPTSTPTSTPTPTNSATPTATATSTATPTQTPTPISGAPDVTVGFFATPTAANSGANVTYQAFVANLGDAAAQNVAVQITLPLGGVLLGIQPGCTTYISGSFLCQLGSLAANNGVPGGPDETSVTFAARLPYGTTNLNAVALALVSASNEPAGNQGDNTASAAVHVNSCPDFNGDNVVNSSDLVIFAATWSTHMGQPAYNPLADLNADGIIDSSDLVIFAARYSTSCVGLDSDHDGVSNFDEINVYHTCPSLDAAYGTLPQCHAGGNTSSPLISDAADTDGDGVPDGAEIFTFHSDPLNPFTSGDFYTDGEAVALGRNPTIYCGIMAADMNMDHVVNSSDLVQFAGTFSKVMGDPGYNGRADFNHDGRVNSSDLVVLAASFNKNVLACP